MCFLGEAKLTSWKNSCILPIILVVLEQFQCFPLLILAWKSTRTRDSQHVCMFCLWAWKSELLLFHRPWHQITRRERTSGWQGTGWRSEVRTDDRREWWLHPSHSSEIQLCAHPCADICVQTLSSQTWGEWGNGASGWPRGLSLSHRWAWTECAVEWMSGSWEACPRGRIGRRTSLPPCYAGWTASLVLFLSLEHGNLSCQG